MKRSPLLACGFGTMLLVHPGAAVTQPNLFNNLAGYWQFDETSGGVAQEASGQGLDGVLINYSGNQGTWSAGKIGGALDFGGLAVKQYVQVPNFTKPTASLTLSAWVWADTLPQWATIAANWNGIYGALNYGAFGSDPYLSLYFAEPHPQGINVANGSEGTVFPNLVAPFSLGAWHHVAVVADAATRRVTFWRDGQTAGSFFYSGSFYPAPVPQLHIGGEPSYGNPTQGYWDGKIDDLALWTRALSSQELAAIYNAGLAGQSLLTLVPEPTAISLLGLGCLGLIWRRRGR